MTIVDTIKNGHRMFMNTKGRASRGQFWSFFVYYVLVGIVVGVFRNVAAIEGLNDAVRSASGLLATLGGIFFFLTGLQIIVAATQRFHDSNRSGWLLFGLFFLPPIFLGAVAVALFGSIVDTLIFAASSANGSSAELSVASPSAPLVVLFGVTALGTVISQLYGIYLLAKSGDAGANRFGPRP